MVNCSKFATSYGMNFVLGGRSLLLHKREQFTTENKSSTIEVGMEQQLECPNSCLECG